MKSLKICMAVLLTLQAVGCISVPDRDDDDDDDGGEAGDDDGARRGGAGGMGTGGSGAQGGSTGGTASSGVGGSNVVSTGGAGGTGFGTGGAGGTGFGTGGTNTGTGGTGGTNTGTGGTGTGGTGSNPGNLPCAIFHDGWAYAIVTYYPPDEEPIVSDIYGTANFAYDFTYEQNYRIGGISNIYAGVYTLDGDLLTTFNEDGSLAFEYRVSCSDAQRSLVLTIEEDDGTPSIVYGLETLLRE